MDAVIVGNSRAAIEAISSFRAYDQSSHLKVISKEKYLPYHRPLIAEYLSGEKSYEEILYVSQDFYSEKDVELLKGVEVVGLDTERRRILTDQAKEIPYDCLLIATGSQPIFPPIPGTELKGVFSFWTLEEAQAISERVSDAESAVVIGAGLVGLSAAHALQSRGLQITLVEMLERVLSPCLDAKGSEIIQKRMDQLGIDLRLNRKAIEIRRKMNSDQVSSILLDDGAEVPCQIVVVSAGVRPNIDFLRSSPLRLDQGILVDQYLETSIPGIFAAGDATQPHNLAKNRNEVIANLHNASEQGRIAGANLAGQKIRYKGGLAMTSMRYFGIPFVSMGILSKTEQDHSEYSIINQQKTIYRKLVTARNVPVGAVLVGAIDQAGIITHMIRERNAIENPKDILDRTLEFEKIRKRMMRESMEGPVQWKKAIGLDQPWRKDHDRIPVSKEESL